MKRGEWSRDLHRVRNGELSFNYFAAKHSGLVLKLATPWVKRTMGRMCVADIEQEILIVVWQAITDWDPSRGFGVDASGYVRMCVRHHLQKLVTRRHIRAVEVDSLFASDLEEYRGGYSEASPYTRVEAAERAAVMFGSVSGRERDSLITALLNGAPRGADQESERRGFARATRRAVEIAAAYDVAV